MLMLLSSQSGFYSVMTSSFHYYVFEINAPKKSLHEGTTYQSSRMTLTLVPSGYKHLLYSPV